MIEIYVMEWIRGKLPGIQVGVIDQDAKTPARIVIERTGGGTIQNHVRTATIAVQSYGPSRYEAALLHERVLESMPGIVENGNISACTLNAEYDFPDYTTKENRYQAVFNIVYFE